MLFKKSNEKELKMIWEVKKKGKSSHLVGTAHFFPYSFRNSLMKLLKNIRVVIFEGPLDKENMAKVRDAGRTNDISTHLFDELDTPPEFLLLHTWDVERFAKDAENIITLKVPHHLVTFPRPDMTAFHY